MNQSTTQKQTVDFCEIETDNMELCFVEQIGTSGHVVPGGQVLSENGYDFLIIDTQCHFWVQKEDFGDVRLGTLSADVSMTLESLGQGARQVWLGRRQRLEQAFHPGPVMRLFEPDTALGQKTLERPEKRHQVFRRRAQEQAQTARTDDEIRFKRGRYHCARASKSNGCRSMRDESNTENGPSPVRNGAQPTARPLARQILFSHACFFPFLIRKSSR